MGFKVSPAATFKWPVVVHQPRDGGKFVKSTFNGEFSYISQDEINQVLENARAGRDNGDLCERVFVGWGPEVTDDSDQPMPVSEENKAALLNIPYVRSGVLAAFIESITGDGARRKN